jgi:hypothetical protein
MAENDGGFLKARVATIAQLLVQQLAHGQYVVPLATSPSDAPPQYTYCEPELRLAVQSGQFHQMSASFLPSPMRGCTERLTL